GAREGEGMRLLDREGGAMPHSIEFGQHREPQRSQHHRMSCHAKLGEGARPKAPFERRQRDAVVVSPDHNREVDGEVHAVLILSTSACRMVSTVSSARSAPSSLTIASTISSMLCGGSIVERSCFVTTSPNSFAFAMLAETAAAACPSA